MYKIWHIGYGHKYDDARILEKECVSLAKSNKYEVTYMTSDKWSPEISKVPDVVDGVNIIIIKRNALDRGRRFYGYLKDVKRLIFENKDTLDAVHIHEFLLWPLCSYSRKLGIKVILDLHEDDLNDTPSRIGDKYGALAKRVVYFFLKRYEKHVLSNAEAVITVTPSIERRINIFSKRTALIANFPIIDKSKKLKSVDEYKLISHNLGFAGGISPLWSQTEILQVMENFNDINYYLAGTVTDEYLEELKKFPSWKNCSYLGLLSRLEVEKLYNKIGIGLALMNRDCLHVDMRTEGTLGNTKFFEFMEQGIPVICSNFSIWREIIDEYNSGIYVDESNPDEIKKAISYFLSNPEIAFEMGQNGRKAIVEKFNWSVDSNKLLKLYDEILK